MRDETEREVGLLEHLVGVMVVAAVVAIAAIVALVGTAAWTALWLVRHRRQQRLLAELEAMPDPPDESCGASRQRPDGG